MSKILIVGPSWVGDMVMAQSLFILLKQLQPDSILHVLAPAWSAPLLARMPEVSQMIEMPLGHGALNLGLRRQMGKELIPQAYDQVILLPNSLKSALIPFWANIPLRTGWRGEYRYGLLNDLRQLDKQVLYKTVERFAALAFPADTKVLPDIPSPQLAINALEVARAQKKFNFNRDKQYLALCPGAEYGPAKRWPEAHFGQLANYFIQRGWQVGLFGSAKDQAVCREINQITGYQAMDLSGQTSLSECLDLLSFADAVVSNDSGLMHVAAALERPLVAIYGSSDPKFTPPLNENHQIMDLNLSCSPCFKRECPLEHLDCLQHIYPEQVEHAIFQLLS